MNNELFIMPLLDLQLFAEGGSAEGGVGSNGGNTVTSNDVNVGSSPRSADKGVSSTKQTVIYGKQTEEAHNAGVQTDNNAEPIDLDAEFEELIKGKYKSQYDARMQNTIQTRLKNAKEQQSKFDSYTPVLQMLGEKYGVDYNDAKKLNEAIQNDNSYYEDEAFEKGISVEQLKELKSIERENAQLKAQLEARARDERANEYYQQLVNQSNEVKQAFPKFDLKTELANPEFMRLINANIPMIQAYKLIHEAEIMPAMYEHATHSAERRLANSINSNAKRPSESASNPNSSVVYKSDPSKYSRDDLMEIRRRVRAGEKITL